jgi:hypothetical protein
MKRNKIAQAFLYMLLHIYMMIVGYCLSLVVSGALLSLVLAVWSAINKIPPAVTDRWWLIYLLTGIPLGIYCYIYQLKGLLKSRQLKQDKKQGNRNQ